jgi:hypothetical protein
MVLDDPVVWLLLIVFAVAIQLVVIYGVYKLAKFLIKVNRYIDGQERDKKKLTP